MILLVLAILLRFCEIAEVDLARVLSLVAKGLFIVISLAVLIVDRGQSLVRVTGMPRVLHVWVPFLLPLLLGVVDVDINIVSRVLA